MRRPNYNPVSLVKEAADKQKVVQHYLERAIPPHPIRHQLPAYQCTVIWHGQVSLHPFIPVYYHNAVVALCIVLIATLQSLTLHFVCSASCIQPSIQPFSICSFVRQHSLPHSLSPFIACLAHPATHSIHSFDCLSCSLARSLTHSLTHSLPHSLYSLTRLLVCWLACLFSHAYGHLLSDITC